MYEKIIRATLDNRARSDILMLINTTLKGIVVQRSITSKPTGTLGPQERRFLSVLASQGMRTFRIEDAKPHWASEGQARKAVSRLRRKGWLQRLERGVYMIVPLEAGPEGWWTEDTLVIATQLAHEGAAAYWTALHYWGMTEQVPRTVFVQTSHRRARWNVTILGVRYRFVSVQREKLFGVSTQTSDGIPFRITDREKTLVDACDRPDLSGGILQIAQALGSGVDLDWGKVDAYLARFGSGAVYKRLGYLAEALDLQLPERNRRLSAWREALTQGIALLEPSAGKAGPTNTRWRVRINVAGLEALA